MSTEASVHLLREASPQSYVLLMLLGCLPDGIQRKHLEFFLTDEVELGKNLKHLESLSFLTEGLDEKI